MSEAQAQPQPTEEEFRRQEYLGRAQSIGQGLTMVINASGAPHGLAIDALSVATSLYLRDIAQRDPRAAAIIANNLALNLVGLCKNLGILPDATEGAGDGAKAN